MKKIYAVVVMFAGAFLALFNSWTAWLCPIWILLGIAILAWGKETGPESWAWTNKKEKSVVPIPTRNPDKDDILFKTGSELVRNKKFDEALSVYDEILLFDPSSDMAWVAKGVIFTHQQKFENAVQAFDQAVFINPTNQKAIQNREMAKKFIRISGDTNPSER